MCILLVIGMYNFMFVYYYSKIICLRCWLWLFLILEKFEEDFCLVLEKNLVELYICCNILIF